jgi:hypothetical protein
VQFVEWDASGTPETVVLCGFAPNKSITLHFYGPGPCEIILEGPQRGNVVLPYIASDSVKVDQTGSATYPWPGAADDKGCFGVRADGANPIQPMIPDYE